EQRATPAGGATRLLPIRLRLSRSCQAHQRHRSRFDQAIRLRNRGELRIAEPRAMNQSTTALTQSFAHPAPRRITPRAASIYQVVWINCATHQNTQGIESEGKT